MAGRTANNMVQLNRHSDGCTTTFFPPCLPNWKWALRCWHTQVSCSVLDFERNLQRHFAFSLLQMSVSSRGQSNCITALPTLCNTQMRFLHHALFVEKHFLTMFVWIKLKQRLGTIIVTVAALFFWEKARGRKLVRTQTHSYKKKLTISWGSFYNRNILFCHFIHDSPFAIKGVGSTDIWSLHVYGQRPWNEYLYHTRY
jgi:hypothetical protein